MDGTHLLNFQPPFRLSVVREGRPHTEPPDVLPEEGGVLIATIKLVRLITIEQLNVTKVKEGPEGYLFLLLGTRF